MNTGIVGGRFQIIKQLGGGTFGETYLAENIQKFRHRCVVKKLRTMAANSKTFEKIKDLFEREAKALYEQGQNHQQIPSLIAYFEEDGQFYLVEEFIEGHDLTDELTPNKKLTESSTLALLENILQPLAYLHENKVIHRDIKPSNLMRRNADGKIFLIDFGAIKELAVTEVINTIEETRIATIIGTPGYMPSEQGTGKPQLASDVYAVGMIGIQATTGLMPQQIEQDPETGELVWQHHASISRELGAILAKMVRYYHKKRYPSAVEALKALRELRESRSSVSNNNMPTATVIVPTLPPEPANSAPLRGSGKPDRPCENRVNTEPTQPAKNKRPRENRVPLNTPEPAKKEPLGRSSKPDRPFEERVTDDRTPATTNDNDSREKTPVSSSSLNRRGWLKWAILSCTGLGMAIVGRTLWDRDTSIPSPSDRDTNFSFKVVKVNRSGEIIARQTETARYFTEDLGNGVEIEMVEIPGGTFLMGTEDDEIERLNKKYKTTRFEREKPQHRVTISPFFMGKFQVTQAQWREVANLPKVDRDLEPNPSRFKRDRLPVESVSSYDAVEFCLRLSREKKREYRLPSEAEWEYACRTGINTPFYFGPTITTELANYDGNRTYASESKGKYRQKTTPVRTFPPNAFGLYDMHGNVWEWCADDWHNNYEAAPTDGSAWLNGDNSFSPLRGGSWINYPINCRSAARYVNLRENRSNYIGFRVVCGLGRTL
ncbi:MAG: bifunctional serine/threonine-protein kinase/formylglycine-generating enzyme family protein [Prochloraceae cyanobacterium]|nr:bifunctional serine/threonine-protein kinase/formylglycine-generating enzyme family protein [Prochloraceae cyanobacterium]